MKGIPHAPMQEAPTGPGKRKRVQAPIPSKMDRRLHAVADAITGTNRGDDYSGGRKRQGVLIGRPTTPGNGGGRRPVKAANENRSVVSFSLVPDRKATKFQFASFFFTAPFSRTTLEAVPPSWVTLTFAAGVQAGELEFLVLFAFGVLVDGRRVDRHRDVLAVGTRDDELAVVGIDRP